MKNNLASAVHPLSTRKVGRPRKAAVGPTNTWLSKRRDGRSDCWMVTWYDPGTRQIRYRTTKTRNITEARQALAIFHLPEGAQSLVPGTRLASTQIYFIGGDMGLIKIGLARDPERRLRTLQCGSPIPLRILASGPGSARDERMYHARFASHRLHGEWFTRHPDILAEIERLVV